MTPKHLVIDGKVIHYDRLHGNLRKKYGKASCCEFCKTKEKKRFEWALIKGKKYSFDINDYIQLCCSCHRKYDLKDGYAKMVSDRMKGKLVGSKNPASRKVIDTVSGEIYETVSYAAKSFGIKRTTLIMMLTGVNKNKTNLKYL